MRLASPRTGRPPGGFTLVELLVVVFIVILVSAVTLPAVLPALQNRQVTEAARILQAALAGARDAAIHANAPRGIRLIPDLTLSDVGTVGGRLVASRILAIEPAPDVNEGLVTFPNLINPNGFQATWTRTDGSNPVPPPFPFPFANMSGYSDSSPGMNASNNYRGRYPYQPYTNPGPSRVLMVEEVMFTNNVPPPTTLARTTPPTSWFWNVRIGDRFRFGDSGKYYTVVGPMTVANPEYFVNDGLPGTTPSLEETYFDTAGGKHNPYPEFLFLVNGVDDDGDGNTDNGVNGANENQNFYASGLNTTAGKPAVDDLGEWNETEAWLGSQALQAQDYHTPPGSTTLSVLPTLTYTITRRPVPVAGAQEVPLPSNVVVDMTSWDTAVHERSRLPVDPNSGFVDIMVNQAGQVIPTTTYSNPGATTMDSAFYHFWLADRSDVYAVTPTTAPQLPIPAPPGLISYPGKPVTLKKDRQLVTLYTRTGQILSNSIEHFHFEKAYQNDPMDPYRPDVPFTEAQLGIREAK